jgi:hypothetical protein
MTINKEVVGMVDDVNVPSHQVHSKAEDGRVTPFISHHKLCHVAIGNPHESPANTHMAIFIHTPIAGKDLPEVRVKLLLVASTATGSKCHWMQSPEACFCKKVKTLPQHVARDKIH